MVRRGRRAWLVLAMLLGLGLSSIQPAWADCQPAIQTPGTIVTCTGSVPTGFAATADALTINILTGALINDDGTSGLAVGQSNTINNFGSIVTGAGTTGILSSGGAFNVINNAGSIIVGDSGTAVTFGSSNTFNNSGSLIVGSGGLLVSGDSDNTIVNTGSMVSDGDGIFVADRNTIRNAGTMTVAGIAISIFSDNTVLNSGTINIGCCGVGIFGNDRNRITNTGTMNLGFGAVGIQVGQNNTIVNDGAIIGGDAATAIIVGDDNTIINNGTISVQSGGAFAIQGGTGNTIVNNGTIAVGDNAGGIFPFDNSSITNNGTIRAGAFGIAIFTPSSTNVVLTNNGTIDGALLLGTCGCGGSNVLNNNGLLTITNAGTPAGVAGYTVGGTFNQSAAGTVALRVAPGSNVNDVLSADILNLAGRLNVVVTAGDYAQTTSYQLILGTTAINGQFAQVATSAFFDITTTYNALDVTVTLTRLGFANGRGATANQRRVGAVLDAQYGPGATGNAATIFNSVQGATSTSVLDALSGEGAAAAQNASFATGNSFLALMLRQSMVARSGSASGGFARSQDGQRVQFASAAVLADAAPAQPRGTTLGPLSLWMAGFGGHIWRDGDSGVGTAAQRIGFGGVATGLDYRLSPNLLIGATVAASGSSYTVPDRSSEGSASHFHFGVYGGFSSGPLYLDGALSYTYADFTSTRLISGVGASERASSAFSGHQFGGRLEAGWRLKLASYGITPFAGVSAQRLRQGAYSESTRDVATGAPGILGLNVAAQSSWSVRSEIGGQIDATYRFDDGLTLKPRLRLAWAHEFSANRPLTASLQSLPAASFTVSGARAARDAAIVSAGLDIGLSSNVTGFAQLDGEFSLSGSAFAAAGGLRVTW
jgi:uncharacterized protein with beta-barrel porin domain